ncbi:MAG: phytanoyl-CoA dioxygenase family protein [Lentisphaeria bacterium]|nr:phytanoyl-CoA dioxygenase family protein [Lentisphaeria bacterium]NQZ70628.1 phytanoyl-CoA dioxygenase family protein [Lentisphaeria bacterium]
MSEKEIELDYIVAPAGFTDEQWNIFMRDGFLTIENALDTDDVNMYLDAMERATEEKGDFDGVKSYSQSNIINGDPVFRDLIDHPRHVGFAYDIYGEQLKMHGSSFLLRTKGSNVNIWHFDGPRVLPYEVFSPDVPLQLKVAYWLSDVPEERMGNFVYLPGSHTKRYVDEYDTHEPIEGEVITTPKPGTMTLMHNALWHRVDENHTDVIRRNIFLSYSPAWITNADHFHSDKDWLETLSREQRIMMREYNSAYDNAKPPPDHFPLFLDRDTESDRDPGNYREHVQLNRRKRDTWVEKKLRETATKA